MRNSLFLAALLATACAESTNSEEVMRFDASISRVDAGIDCPDEDHDGFQDAKCNPDVSKGGGDCDDTNSMVYPGRKEICNNAMDDNCDGLFDREDTVDCAVICKDLDQDGYQEASCNPDVNNFGGDCDDTNSTVHPGRGENCGNEVDNDCNGLKPSEDPGCQECPDMDLDGYPNIYLSNGELNPACINVPTSNHDCNDTDPRIHPNAIINSCGGGDQNCDGQIEFCLPNCEDKDHDGFGVGAGCFGPDCNDFDPLINPWHHEICGDGIDQNCDGYDLPCPQNCEDNDHDGFGIGPGCLGLDCNDFDPNIAPSAREIPDNDIDEDCNGHVLYLNNDCLDHDQDGYGVGRGCLRADCDDNNPLVNQGRFEICGNGLDDDCLGGDAVCTTQGTGTCTDLDGDGYGNGACPLGGPDCDDHNPNVNPGATEICDGIDNNCNGQIDECPRRNQVCNASRECVGQVGSPCQSAFDCDVTYTCDQESHECRIGDGERCNNSAECTTTSTCTSLDDGVCDGFGTEPHCFQTKGGPCSNDCSCDAMWVCHNGLCSECNGDDEWCDYLYYDLRPSCMPGGFCVLPQTFGGSGHDVYADLFKAQINCWSSNTGQHITQPQGCAQLNMGTLFQTYTDSGSVQNLSSITFDSAKSFACNYTYLRNIVSLNETQISNLREVYGCGGIVNSMWKTTALTPGNNNNCMFYVPRQFGFANLNPRASVTIAPCTSSTF